MNDVFGAILTEVWAVDDAQLISLIAESERRSGASSGESSFRPQYADVMAILFRVTLFQGVIVMINSATITMVPAESDGV